MTVQKVRAGSESQRGPVTWTSPMGTASSMPIAEVRMSSHSVVPAPAISLSV